MDRRGRSFGEAEVEFAQRSGALECIARLDNEVADGEWHFPFGYYAFY